MKNLFTSLFFLTLSSISFAQAPQSFSYQAIARNSSGAGISNQNIGLRISILQGSVTGTSVYTETHTALTDANGILNLAIGTGTVTAGAFSAIPWETGTYFVQVEMDITGGTNYVLMGTSQLLSVPYALYAGGVSLSKNNTPFDLYIGDDGTTYALKKITVEHPYSQTPTITDASGNSYGTVKIGTQVWMTENLRTTKLNDGTAIVNVPSGAAWSAATSPAYVNVNNTLNTDTINDFGRFYNFYTVNTNKLCPVGWHVPSEDEFKTLMAYLGPLTNFRIRDAKYWEAQYGNLNAVNDTHLSFYPTGARQNMYSPGQFTDIGISTALWTSTATSTTATTLIIYGNFTYTNNSCLIPRSFNFGLPVRCIKN